MATVHSSPCVPLRLQQSPSTARCFSSEKMKTSGGPCLILVNVPVRPRCLLKHSLFTFPPSTLALSRSLWLHPLSPAQLHTSRSLRPLFSSPDDNNNLEPADYQPHQLAKSNSGFFVEWEIPWDGKTVLVTITVFGLSFLFTGLAVSVLLAGLGLRRKQLLDFDERSFLVFINQVLQTVAGIAVIKACTKSFSPLPNGLFRYDASDPFSFSRGWLLWSVIGIFCGTGAVVLAGTLTTYLNGEPLPREGQDALLQLLPLIGTSGTSTAFLLAVTGVLAPVLEETLFRGFLLTSLTKWMPTYAAVMLSAGAFAIAHLTPGQVPQLFALGVVLGFSYSKSGNLLTPIVIHGLWNSGVLVLLTLLRLQGYDIQELI